MNKTAQVIIGLIVIALIVWGGYTLFSKPRPAAGEPIRIGALLPLSGVAAYYAENSRRGIELAREEILSSYPDRQFDIIYEDSFYNPKGGVDAYNKLRLQDKPDAVLTAATHVSVAIIPLTTEDKIIQMAIWASGQPYSKPDDLTFRVSADSNLETAVMADFIKDKGFKRLGILYLNNEFGISFKDDLKKNLAKNNINITRIEEGFLVDTNDFRTMLLKIKQAGVDAVFMVGTPNHYVNILKQAHEISLGAKFLTIRSAEDPLLIKNAGDLAEGLFYTYAFDKTSGIPEAKKFETGFREKYDTAPDGYAAEGYEGFKLLALAFINCGKDSVCVKSWLENLKDYKSVFGDIHFDKNGDVFYNFFLKTIKNGQFVMVE